MQPAQRVEVGAELSVRMRHDRRTPAQHGVAGQHRSLSRQHERKRVRGVTGRRHDAYFEAIYFNNVTIAEPLVAELMSAVQGTYAAPHPLRKRPRGLGVIRVTMREEYDGHRSRLVGDSIKVRRDLRTGVDHDRVSRARLAQNPGVGAIEGHHVRVRSEQAGRTLPEPATGPRGHDRIRALT